jgi:hypothetical protein
MTLDLTDWQNKKYQTLDGRPVRLLCVDKKGDYPIVGLVIGGPHEEVIGTWTKDGLWNLFLEKTDADLINAKTKREGWVNVYPEDTRVSDECGYLYSTKERADVNAAEDVRVACVRIEWEE